jgi:hypothetical protein
MSEPGFKSWMIDSVVDDLLSYIQVVAHHYYSVVLELKIDRQVPLEKQQLVTH